jgi:hypothetical protein
MIGQLTDCSSVGKVYAWLETSQVHILCSTILLSSTLLSLALAQKQEE